MKSGAEVLDRLHRRFRLRDLAAPHPLQRLRELFGHIPIERLGLIQQIHRSARPTQFVFLHLYEPTRSKLARSKDMKKRRRVAPRRLPTSPSMPYLYFRAFAKSSAKFRVVTPAKEKPRREPGFSVQYQFPEAFS